VITQTVAIMATQRPAPHDRDPPGNRWKSRCALELWDWFASIGQVRPLGSLADDMIKLITAD
jgi:hypothetical protein